MFTGLIQDVGVIASAEQGAGPLRIGVATRALRPEDLQLGESVATNGICLTVVERTGSGYVAEAGQETLERTTAGSWRVGRRVNLERALRLSDRLGGHLVLGHVDGLGHLRERRELQGVLHLVFAMPEPIAPLVCEKGSVAIDGVSLTVNEAHRDTFRVTLIPETRIRTTLQDLHPGDAVNLEADVIARHLARLLAFGGEAAEAAKSRVDLEFLARHGYL